MSIAPPAVGPPLSRVEGREKVMGRARYAYEEPVEGVAYAAPVTATIAAGEVAAIDGEAALALPGVLALVSHENAPRLADTDDEELRVFQSPRVAYRGAIVAAVVAETLEAAHEAAAAVRVEYAPRRHDVELREDHPDLYKPDKVNPSFPTDVAHGDAEAALASAAVVVDATYSTQPMHNNPMEPHASLALWENGGLTLYDSIQGPYRAATTFAKLFDLPPEAVRVISQHVAGVFGFKDPPRRHPVL